MGLTVTDVGLEKKDSSPELKKHAATIHCSNSLSLLQRKISNALLYHAYKELQTKEEHEITVKQLCRLIGYSGNNHAAIKEGLKGLISTVIEWNVVSDTTGQEDWTASSILASVSLRGPICLYAYSPRMKALLHSPSMFGKINLFIQSRFKSSYGLALYENCIRYRGLPYTKWLEMDVFRKLMGVPADKYPIFRDFKRRVLDKSIEEVNTYSDLIVEADFLKEGRQVSKVRFLLKERAKKVRLGTQSIEDEKDTLKNTLQSKLMADFSLSREQAIQVMAEYSETFIQEKMEIVESSQNYQKGRVHNLAGYFLSALKNNFLPEKSVVLIKHKKAEALKETQQRKDELEENYQIYRESFIDREFDSLAVHEKNAIIQKFYDVAEPAIQTVLKLQKNKYTRDTVLASPQIKGLLRQFILRECKGIQERLCSFEKFIERECTEESEMEKLLVT